MCNNNKNKHLLQKINKNSKVRFFKLEIKLEKQTRTSFFKNIDKLRNKSLNIKRERKKLRKQAISL